MIWALIHETWSWLRAGRQRCTHTDEHDVLGPDQPHSQRGSRNHGARVGLVPI